MSAVPFIYGMFMVALAFGFDLYVGLTIGAMCGLCVGISAVPDAKPAIETSVRSQESILSVVGRMATRSFGFGFAAGAGSAIILYSMRPAMPSYWNVFLSVALVPAGLYASRKLPIASVFFGVVGGFMMAHYLMDSPDRETIKEALI